MTIAQEIESRVMSSKKLRRRVPSWREFASTIVLPAGPLAGTRYRLGSDPCQSYLLAEMDSGRWERYYICAPAQVGGKSLLAIQLPILRTTIGQRLPAGYALPTLADLDKAWTEKLHPQLKRSGYGEHLPKSGPGSRGGRGHTLTLRDPETGDDEGTIVFLAGGAYGSTVASVVVDEADQFRTADGTPRWDAIEDCFQRAVSYGRKAFRVAAGTVEDDAESIILILVCQHGTGTRPWPACPSCNRHQLLSWAHVEVDLADDDSARTSARIRCQHCPAQWDEDGRQKAIRRSLFVHRGQTVNEQGEIVGDPPRTRYLGLIWTGLDSALDNLGDLAVAWRQAQALVTTHSDHALARKFTHYKLCQAYTADTDERHDAGALTWESILARSQRCLWGPVLHTTDRGPESEQHTFTRHAAAPPDTAQFACAGVDVQNNRLYLDLEAVDADGGTYATGWSIEYARPDRQPWNKQELHNLLDRANMLIRRWAGDLPIPYIGLDCREFTDELRAWVDTRSDGWVPIMGTGRTHEVQDPDIDVDGIAWLREGIFHIHVDHTRELVHAALRRANGQPGAAHLPNGLSKNGSDVAYCKHLVGEQLALDRKTGKAKLVQHGRWDWLDAKRIATALIRVHQQARSRPIQKPIDLSTWNRRG